MLRFHLFPFGSPLGHFEQTPTRPSSVKKGDPLPPSRGSADACAGALAQEAWVPPNGRCPFWGRGNGLRGAGVHRALEGSRGPSRGCGPGRQLECVWGGREDGVGVNQRPPARTTCCGTSGVGPSTQRPDVGGGVTSGGRGRASWTPEVWAPAPI